MLLIFCIRVSVIIQHLHFHARFPRASYIFSCLQHVENNSAVTILTDLPFKFQFKIVIFIFGNNIPVTTDVIRFFGCRIEA